MEGIPPKLSPFDLNLRETGKPPKGAMKIGPETFDSVEDLVRFIRNPETPKRRGKFHAILKLNGGYGRNHETGATVVFSWSGPLRYGLKEIGFIEAMHREGHGIPLIPDWLFEVRA